MAQIIPEELWIKPAVERKFIWLVTTNGMLVNNERSLIMGGGAAYDAAVRFSNAPTDAARIIKSVGKKLEDETWFYGLVIVYPPSENGGLGLFQTKFDPSYDSSLPLIKKATHMLTAMATENPDVLYRLNYPGIGLGGLSKEKVAPILAELPDNVTVCFVKTARR